MDTKQRTRMQLECLYDMFRDKIEENVIYIVYSENEGKIEETIDQLMSIAACSFTGYCFENKPITNKTQSMNGLADKTTNVPTNASRSATSSPSVEKLTKEELLKKDGHRCDPKSSRDQRDSQSEVLLYDKDTDDEQQDLDKRIEIVQDSIENLLNEKKTCHDKASHYLGKKMYPVTSYYSELSSNYRRMIEDKTRKLIDLLLLKSSKANTIDLHGLNPIQAKLVVNELLNIRQEQLCIDKQGEANIDIITGWGKHSIHTGQHRIRPTIVALVREKGFDYQLINKGALRVTIRR